MKTDSQRVRAAVMAMVLAVGGWLPCSAWAGDAPSTTPPQAVNTNAAAGDTSSNVLKAGPINNMDELDDRHKLAMGDHLSFRIIEDQDEPKELSVTVSGDIEVPYLGLYRVIGLTCKQIALKLKTELEKKYYYHATVILAVTEWARSQGKVYFVGPVRSTVPLEIPSDEVLTLSKAILRAGGFGDYANRNKVEVRRKADGPAKEQVFTVDVAQILDKGRTDLDVPLKDLDVIYIPERLVRF